MKTTLSVKRSVVCLLAMTFGLAFIPMIAGAVDKATHEDLVKAIGTWELVEHHFNGKPEEVTKTILTVKDDEEDNHDDDCYEMSVNGKVVEAGILYFDPEVKPKAYLVAQYAKFNHPGIFRGIYEISADKLTLCVNSEADGKRPTEFAAKAGTKHRLYVFKRAAKTK